MDSSGSGTVDCGVGSIVWVRRRNGSWWPGQILGQDELSSSHLTSPRSGTPVKLLGREDASVDWYNLEKSKRVKAFRCGDFDDCIERAESSQGMPLKKREKYARREDAILHALELEREMLKKQGKLGIASYQTNCRSSIAVRKGIVTSSETMGNDNEKCQNSNSHTSYEYELPGGPLLSNIANDGSQLSGEDHSEATPRMRGLLDFGLKIAPLKGKFLSSVDPNISQKLTFDDSAQALPSDGLSLGSAVHADGQIGVAYRSKRSRIVYLPAESSDSLDYKETPTNVEMSSSQFGGVCPHPGSLAEESESAFIDDIESDSSETESTDSDSDSDSSETEPDMDEEMTILSEAGRDAEEHGSTSEEPDELAISSDMPHLYSREGITSNEAVSKWQLKGKRNNRNLVKRPVGALDGRGNIYGIDNDERRSHLSHKKLGPSMHFHGNDFADAFDDDEIYGLEDKYTFTSRAVSKCQNKIRRGQFWDDWIWEDQPALKGYRDVKGFTPVYDDCYFFSGSMRPMLVNVDLKVQASYQKEPVPIVSLTSKIDGRAIIGHPIQIETLQDGSSDSLLSAFDDCSYDGISVEGSSVLPPAWRTARRTANFRVPRPHVPSSNCADAAAEFSFSHKACLSKSVHNSPRPTTDNKSSKKGSRKASLSSSQKTRTLSSLSIEHSLSKKSLHNSSSYRTDRLIKPVASGPTTVAYIPVKLVFSRLLEKINRPPLKAADSAALSNTFVKRNS